jgi:CysZ protein
VKAIEYHIEALKVVFTELSKGRFLLFFLPGLVVAIFFGGIFSLTSEAEGMFSFVEKIPLIGGILGAGVSKTFGMISFLVMQIYIFFILTVLSPFNTVLSESFDSHLTGKEYKFDLGQVFLDMMRMVFVVLVSLTMEFFVMGSYWVLSWILGLGFMDFIVYSVISGFFFGLSFYDYSLERYKQGVFSTFGYAFSKFGMVTLTGLVFMLIFAIPYIGIPIAPVIATMIATVIYIKQLK